MISITTSLRTATLVLALGSLAACFGDNGAGVGADVVLIDRSGSIAPGDRNIYARSIDSIGDGLDTGGRMLVAEIGDTDRSRFQTLLDLRAEDSDVRLKREANLRKARAELADAIPGLLPEGPGEAADSTRILEAIAAASEAFRPGAGEAGRLFILSDGVEEGPVVNLARLPGGPEAIGSALEEARATGLLPDLRGVKIYIIGAGGDGTSMGVQGIRSFWQAYADATGATLVRIGRLPYDAG